MGPVISRPEITISDIEEALRFPIPEEGSVMELVGVFNPQTERFVNRVNELHTLWKQLHPIDTKNLSAYSKISKKNRQQIERFLDLSKKVDFLYKQYQKRDWFVAATYPPIISALFVTFIGYRGAALGITAIALGLLGYSLLPVTDPFEGED